MSTRELVLDHITKTRMVAVIRLPDLGMALELSRALLDGGITALEFTLTNRDSLRVITEVKAAFPVFGQGEAIIGAGSVNSAADAEASIAAGAQFVVAPTTKLPVIAVCKTAAVPVMPGAFTPTEIETAWEAGADVVKVFPASFLGPKFIKAVLAPLPHLKLMPTGGVSLDNLGEYLRMGAVGVGVGGSLLDKAAIAAGDWAAVSAHAQKYADAAHAGRDH